MMCESHVSNRSILSTFWRKAIDHRWDYLLLFVIAGVIIGLDQFTKVWVRANVPIWTDFLPEKLSWLTPIARIRHVYNTGAAFGIFKQGGWIFSILAFVVSIAIISYYPSTARKDWWLRLALGLQLGGALGNLIDRIAFGGVTDFISVGSFAIFNVADSSITIGVVILIIGVWWTERQQKVQSAEVIDG